MIILDPAYINGVAYDLAINSGLLTMMYLQHPELYMYSQKIIFGIALSIIKKTLFALYSDINISR